MPTDKQLEAEDAFRKSLEDVVLVAEKLAPLAERTEDLVGMLKLAILNLGQLRMIIELVIKNKEPQPRR